MNTKRIGDIDVAWTEQGDGEPVVLIHGLAEDRHTWAAQQSALSGCRTYAYDLRGHGDSTVGTGRGEARQLAEDLIGFLENVTGPAACVGFSLGGTIVLTAAAMRPELFRRAIVVGASSVVGRSAAEFYRMRISMIEHGVTDEFRAGLHEDTAAALHNPSVDVAAVTARRLAAIGDGRGYVNAATAMARVNAEPLTETLPLIPIHVDVVGGEFDSFCPRKASDLIMAGLRDATFREIPNVGHLMNVDDPAAVTAMIESILSSTPNPQPKENP